MQNSKISNVENLFQTVVNNGYCIGCGACASVYGSGIKMEFDKFGCYKAVLISEQTQRIEAHVTGVCPFSDSILNENEISKRLFEQNCQYHKQIGYFSALYAGYVSENDFRENGSSGGMVSWILCELLKNNLVDGILHVKSRLPTKNDSRLFHYQVSRSSHEVCSSTKSRYYPIEMSEVLNLVIDQPGRYAIVGVPCFIKAIRLLISQNKILKERIHYCLALVCGHLKSKEYTTMLAWQCGIKPGNLLSIDFRKKIAKLNASQYGIEVTGKIEGKLITHNEIICNLYGSDWGLGFFKYKACDYCDDLFGETADLTVGDAWIKPYLEDDRGNNIVIIRNLKIKELVEKGISTGRLVLDPINCNDVVKSQIGGLHHRRMALSYRLFIADKMNKWRPTKRVLPQESLLNNRLKRKHSLRMQLSKNSHIAFQYALNSNQFSDFVGMMEDLVQEYRFVEQPFWKYILKKIILLLK